MGHSQARHALIREPQREEPHDHYHVVIQVYDGDKQIGKTIHHWQIDRTDDAPQGLTVTHSQTYQEPGGKTVHLAVQAEARRQVLD